MDLLSPMLASGALKFAFEKATTEGKMTIGVLIIVSIFSWTVIITKARQLIRAHRMGKRFFEAYRSTRDPLEMFRATKEFDGAPAYELYYTGAEELEYHLKNNPVQIEKIRSLAPGVAAASQAQTDMIARSITVKISH